MAEEFRWINGQAHIQGAVEKICPSTHITQNQWDEGWNAWFVDGEHSYSYISDYECCFNHPVVHEEVIAFYDQERWQNLQDAKQQGMNVRITNLAHFTGEEVAENIIQSGGFEGGEKKVNEDDGNDITAKLSWWSPKFMVAERNQVRGTLGGAIEPFLGEDDVLENLKGHFATSHAFRPNPRRYGNFYFEYNIDELFQRYANYIDQDVQYKILGTYAYKQEIMHAVLVCSEADGAGQFAAYPNVLTPAQDVHNQAVVTRDEDGGWLWKPQATSTKIRRIEAHLQQFPKYRRWEHVAFAFHTPGDAPFNIPELPQHLHQL